MNIHAIDVEVTFEFNGVRRNPAGNGYRPDHLIADDYLTTGIHHYYDVTEVPPNGIAKGIITFISPDAFPACFWPGKKIGFYEGPNVVGHAIIEKVMNPILMSQDKN